MGVNYGDYNIGDNCEKESAEKCDAEAGGQHDVARRKGGFEFGFGYLSGISLVFADQLHFKLLGCLLISYFTFLLVSEIRIGKRKIYIGVFDCEIKAHEAYLKKCIGHKKKKS